jgi:hypothetical protein
VYGRLGVEPVPPLATEMQPLAGEHVLRADAVVARVPHAGHVPAERFRAVALDGGAVVRLLPRHGAQRLDQLRQPEEVVVGLHHVVVRVVGVELGRRGEEGVRLAAVEVLLAPVEDDDVALGQHFERHQHALVVLVQPAPDEAHAHVRRQVVELQPVHHAQQVPPLVQVGAGQHADQQPEVGRRGGVIRAQQRAARAHLSSPAARTPWGTRRR